jgi:Lsm C-terminal
MEKPFDFKALSDRLARVFPGLVKIREDVGAIIVMDKIKVTQAGVEEGVGLAADRVRAIYEEFMRETKK